MKVYISGPVRTTDDIERLKEAERMVEEYGHMAINTAVEVEKLPRAAAQGITEKND